MSKRATTRQANAEFKAVVDDIFEATVGYKPASDDVPKATIKDLLESYKELKSQSNKLDQECNKILDEINARLKPVADAARELGLTGMYVSPQPNGKFRIDVRYDDKAYVAYVR